MNWSIHFCFAMLTGALLLLASSVVVCILDKLGFSVQVWEVFTVYVISNVGIVWVLRRSGFLSKDRKY